MPIPNSFNANGVLDPGTYNASFANIRSSILITGTGSPTWDTAWRNTLLNNVETLVKQLWEVGVSDVFLDGSFVEDKDHPNDIDGYFDPHLSMFDPADMAKFQKIVSDLNNMDPHKIWDWHPHSRKQVHGFGKKQLPMWIFYRVEFYPHLDQGTGIKDQHGNDLKFPSAFRQSRHNFSPKGVIKVIP